MKGWGTQRDWAGLPPKKKTTRSSRGKPMLRGLAEQGGLAEGKQPPAQTKQPARPQQTPPKANTVTAPVAKPSRSRLSVGLGLLFRGLRPTAHFSGLFSKRRWRGIFHRDRRAAEGKQQAKR